MPSVAVNIPVHELHAQAARQAFRNWAGKDKVYKKLFKKLEPEGQQILDEAFGELHSLKPGVFDYWWAQNHMRYFTVKGTQQRLVHELAYNFLGRFSRGELKNESVKRPAKATRPSKVK